MQHPAIQLLKLTFNPGIMPLAASKQAPDIRPCSRNSGGGASPNLPSGSEPITLKYLIMVEHQILLLRNVHVQRDEVDLGEILLSHELFQHYYEWCSNIAQFGEPKPFL